MNRIDFKDLKQLQGTPYEPAYNNWVKGQQEEIIEKIEMLRKDPLLEYKSYEELTQDISKEIKTKARNIKQDPANTNLLNRFFNDVKNLFGMVQENLKF